MFSISLARIQTVYIDQECCNKIIQFWSYAVILWISHCTQAPVSCDHLLQCIIVFGFVWYEPLKYDDYTYPGWANAIGWGMAFSSILCMPILAIGAFFLSSGSIPQVGCHLYFFVLFILKSLCYTFKTPEKRCYVFVRYTVFHCTLSCGAVIWHIRMCVAQKICHYLIAVYQSVEVVLLQTGLWGHRWRIL